MAVQPVGEAYDAQIFKGIQDLRKKLLDLTPRNPLISFNLSGRVASVRIIDELPDEVITRLRSGTPMRLEPLPGLDVDPRDEGTEQFETMLGNLKQSESIFLDANDAVASGDRTALKEIDRALRDRLRDILKMPPREHGPRPNLDRHALNHLIRPDFELPTPDGPTLDDRHQDLFLQTKLLPDIMEATLNKLRDRSRSWESETGVNALNAAFGFVEHQKPGSNDNILSPLVMLPVELTRSRSSKGFRFDVQGAGEPELNPALRMQMAEMGTEMPPFEGGSLEEYFEALSLLEPGGHWRVRRQIAFSVFPSTDLAAYKDLDTNQPSFALNGIVRDLMAGIAAEPGTSVYAGTYDVDAPAVEKHVPICIVDADSTQFSTLVDIAQGKNLAVEGPPGTGKSQTIVNAIATAMYEGKKVLFVAQKKAALDVVYNRLAERRLGEFVLPLMPRGTNAPSLIDAIRERRDIENHKAPDGLAEKIERRRKLRDDLKSYIDQLHQPFGSRGLKVHQILGEAIKANKILLGLPPALQKASIPGLSNMSATDIEDLRQAAIEYERHLDDAKHHRPSPWRDLKAKSLDNIASQSLLDRTKDAAETNKSLIQVSEQLATWHLASDTPTGQLKSLASVLQQLPVPTMELDVALINDLVAKGDVEELTNFVDQCHEIKEASDFLSRIFSASLNRATLAILKQTLILLDRQDLEPSAIRTPDTIRNQRLGRLRDDEITLSKVQAFLMAAEAFEARPMGDLQTARELLDKVGNSALSLRHSALFDSDRVAQLPRAIDHIRTLQARKAHFESLFHLDRVDDPSDLRKAARHLKQTGLLSGLSGNVRRARQFYKGIAKRPEQNWLQAGNQLEAIARWLQDKEQLNADAGLQVLLGPGSRGIETDTDGFEQLSEYLTGIDKAFPGIENRTLRQFLKETETELLKDLPDIGSADPALNFPDFTRSVAQRQASATDFDRDMDTLEKNFEIFCDLDEEGSFDWLSDVSALFEKYCDLCDSIATNQTMQKLLDYRLEAVRQIDRTFRDECSLARIIIQSDFPSDTVLQIWIDDQTEQFLDVSSAVIEHRDRMDDLLAQISEAAVLPENHPLRTTPIEDRQRLLTDAANDADGLHAHAFLAYQHQKMDDHGLLWMIDALAENQENAGLKGLGDIVAAVHWRAMAVAVRQQIEPTLLNTYGSDLDRLRQRFAALDRQIIELGALQVRAKLVTDADPPAGVGSGPKSTYTELSLLKHQMNLTRRSAGPRRLALKAGNALRAWMPCWMMSPQAVAQYLPAGKIDFDLVIIDEASQMRPEHALGALLRARQAVIVGDVNQMPPSSFFQRMLDDGDQVDGDGTIDEDAITVVEESILQLANNTYNPRRMLGWHYRSRHPDLIRYSNESMYAGKMLIFPNAIDTPEMGVHLVEVDGKYHSGKNDIEAEAIVDAAIRHMRETPDLSLGIVTMNLTQADVIREKLQFRERDDAVVRAFNERWANSLESLFIKNLENVQGDERDVIFIGTLFGPPPDGGPVRNTFGPGITGAAGRNYLNVLFSRAKQCIVTFTSMKPSDIKAARGPGTGPHMLRGWLEYCKTGRIEQGTSSGREPDSPFEIHVAEQIARLGYEVEPQVGVKGYFIDIGVKHPDWPYGYLLGVECDGASYHSSQSARDRDRLREEVLYGLGWRLHRIWSTDWFRNPSQELVRLQETLSEVLNQRLKEPRDNHRNPTATDDVAEEGGDESKEDNDQGAEVIAFPSQPSVQSDAPSPRDDDEAMSDLFSPPQDFGSEAAQSHALEKGPPADKHPVPREPENVTWVEVGDTVRVSFLNDTDKDPIQVTLSADTHRPEDGLIGPGTPMAEALLECEVDDEVELLIGHRIRRALIERITKPR